MSPPPTHEPLKLQQQCLQRMSHGRGLNKDSIGSFIKGLLGFRVGFLTMAIMSLRFLFEFGQWSCSRVGTAMSADMVAANRIRHGSHDLDLAWRSEVAGSIKDFCSSQVTLLDRLLLDRKLLSTTKAIMFFVGYFSFLYRGL